MGSPGGRQQQEHLGPLGIQVIRHRPTPVELETGGGVRMGCPAVPFKGPTGASQAQVWGSGALSLHNKAKSCHSHDRHHQRPRGGGSSSWTNRQCWRPQQGGTILPALSRQAGAGQSVGRYEKLGPRPSKELPQTLTKEAQWASNSRSPWALEAAQSHKMTSVQGPGAHPGEARRV